MNPSYYVDQTRLDILDSGFPIRAKNRATGRYDTYDIIQLDKPSLLAWLRSRGGDNEYAENVVLLLLGHSGE